MENIINIITQLYIKYPNSNQLSYSRVMKLLYLIEWKYSITEFERISKTDWLLTEHGPLYNKLPHILEESDNFDIITKFDKNNKQQLIIKFNLSTEIPTISEKSNKIIDFVIEHCKILEWSELNNIVNSTYGIMNSSLNHIIEIENLAKEYKNVL
jgi:hypothetical protein